jgi:hypothetical protein
MDADWTKGRQMRRPFDLNKVPPPEIEPEESLVGYFASSATSSSMHYRNSPYPIFEPTSSSSGNYVDKPYEHNRFPISSPGKRIATVSDQRSRSKRPGEGELITNKDTGEHFNVHNWDFLRHTSRDEETAEYQKEFLQFLKGCKGDRDTEGVFFIQRDQALDFMRLYSGERLDPKFSIPDQVSYDFRLNQSYEILLQISDKKINLESNEKFSKGIMAAMKKKIGENSFVAKSATEKRQAKVENFVKHFTKVTHLLMIVVLSIYREHEQEFLTVNEVEEHMNSIKDLWFRLEEGKVKPKEDGNDWGEQVHDILRFNHKALPPVGRKRFHLVQKFLRYWLEEKDMQLKKDKVIHADTMTEIINKMIFFSNYKHMMSG